MASANYYFQHIAGLFYWYSIGCISHTGMDLILQLQKLNSVKQVRQKPAQTLPAKSTYRWELEIAGVQNYRYKTRRKTNV